jgi:endoglucanase
MSESYCNMEGITAPDRFQEAGAFCGGNVFEAPLSVRIGYGMPDRGLKPGDRQVEANFDSSARGCLPRLTLNEAEAPKHYAVGYSENSAGANASPTFEHIFISPFMSNNGADRGGDGIPHFGRESVAYQPGESKGLRSLYQILERLGLYRGEGTGGTVQMDTDSSKRGTTGGTGENRTGSGSGDSKPLPGPDSHEKGHWPPFSPNTEEKRHHGVNLSGAEFGERSIPGRLGTDYTFPTTQELDYYKQKGMGLIRLPFFWERMQPGLLNKNSPDASVDRSFDPVYAGEMEKFLTAADQRGLEVVLDAQQFGRYKNQVIGAGNITDDDFKQFWGEMAKRFGQHPCIYGWDLSNEPHDEDARTWHEAAQSGVDGIRAAGDKHAVIVEGINWSGAQWWDQYNNDLYVDDPANNTIYSAHTYWDTNFSGSYDNGAPGSYDRAVASARERGFLKPGEDPSNLGINEARPFVEWLKKHNARGYFGEYGVPANDDRWIKVQDKFLSFARANNIDTTAWGGGPWWGKDSILSLETGPKGDQSLSGPEPENRKSVERDGEGA